MHPFTAQWLAEDRMAQAQRDAARWRLTALASLPRTAPRRHPARHALGSWLVAAGARLLEPPPVSTRRI